MIIFIIVIALLSFMMGITAGMSLTVYLITRKTDVNQDKEYE